MRFFTNFPKLPRPQRAAGWFDVARSTTPIYVDASRMKKRREYTVERHATIALSAENARLVWRSPRRKIATDNRKILAKPTRPRYDRRYVEYNRRIMAELYVNRRSRERASESAFSNPALCRRGGRGRPAGRPADVAFRDNGGHGSGHRTINKWLMILSAATDGARLTTKTPLSALRYLRPAANPPCRNPD